MGTREQLLAGIVSDPHDVALRLVYADWLEEHGDEALAGFIRARVALDGHVPDAEVYPTLIEGALESLAGERKPDLPLPAGFAWGAAWARSPEQWWADCQDGLVGGLPSFVEANEGDAGSLVAGVAEIVGTTPVRGIRFGAECLAHLPAVLASPAARHLRRIALEGPPPAGASVSPVQAVAASPVASELARLQVGDWDDPLNDADAAALADASFERLEGLDVFFTACSEAGLVRLLEAPWFRRLRRLLLGLKPRYGGAASLNPAHAAEVRRLGGMAALHTLMLWQPGDLGLAGLAEAGELPGLRRLCVRGADLSGNFGAALGRLRAPKLIELWLSECKLGKADLKVLAATPLFGGLRVLTFDQIGLTHTALDAVAASPCAKGLRILRLRGGAFRSLARSALGRRGAFPGLTTLVLSPFPSTLRERDTAAFLAALDTPGLRHLTLDYCGFDDACAEALVANPALAGLTRLVIKGGVRVRPATLRALLRSPSLRNLVVLELSGFDGAGAEVLADPAVLPRLTLCVLRGVADPVAAALCDRPVVRCY